LSNNRLEYKEKVAPEWYLNGPTKIFTKEEIEEWEARSRPAIDIKLKAQENLSIREIKLMDQDRWQQEEDSFKDIMGGYDEGPASPGHRQPYSETK
jgi:hypothetical protein